MHMRIHEAVFTPVQCVKGHSQPFNSLENIYKLMIALLLETENNVYILSCTDLICLLKTSFDCCLVTTIKTIMCFTLMCRFNMALQTSFDCYLVTTIRTRMCLPSCTYFTCFFKLSFVEYLIEIPGTWHF